MHIEHNHHEDIDSNTMKICHPLDYATDPRSHLPTIEPITEYFKLPTLEDPSTEDTDEHETSAFTHQAELLRLHYCLAHVSFKTLRLLINLRIIPYHLREVHPPKCASYMYVAMTKKNWRAKWAANRDKVHPSTQPSNCVYVDHLESTTPWFIAQLKGRLTKDRYRCATNFLDNYSSLSYVHLQRSTNGDDTLEERTWSILHSHTIQKF